MEKKEKVKLLQEGVQKLFESGYSSEYKYIERYGKPARETLLKMSNSTEPVRSDKLDKDLTLDCALVKEKTESDDGFVTYGSEFYEIQIKDGKKELGKCVYKLEQRGIHLSFIGLDENLDSSYQGVGLGSIMINKLEAFCKTLGAQYIEGKYTPIGKFASSSEAFYKRHNFKFEVDYEDHGRTYIRKEIQREPEPATDQKNEKNS